MHPGVAVSTAKAQDGGRNALLDAAAILMDQRGVDHASLNEINRFAGQHNRSAVQYHFGSRDALVLELAQRTMMRLDVERTALLNHLEATQGQLSERQALEVAVLPMASQLATIEGRRHLRLIGQLLNHPRYNADARDSLGLADSLGRCAAYVAPLLAELPEQIRVERASQAIMFLVRALADQARLIDAEPPARPPLPDKPFAANLIDVITGILTAAHVPAST